MRGVHELHEMLEGDRQRQTSVAQNDTIWQYLVPALSCQLSIPLIWGLCPGEVG